VAPALTAAAFAAAALDASPTPGPSRRADRRSTGPIPDPRPSTSPHGGRDIDDRVLGLRLRRRSERHVRQGQQEDREPRDHAEEAYEGDDGHDRAFRVTHSLLATMFAEPAERPLPVLTNIVPLGRRCLPARGDSPRKRDGPAGNAWGRAGQFRSVVDSMPRHASRSVHYLSSSIETSNGYLWDAGLFEPAKRVRAAKTAPRREAPR